MFRPLHHLLCCVLATICLLAGERVKGEVPTPTAFADWLISAWQTEEGLPQNAVTALFQSRSGYLWIGTFNGLARFDGANFTTFDPANTPALRSGRVTSIFEDAERTLWVGQDTGDLAALRAGVWRSVPLPDGWPGGTIRSIQVEADGTLWLLHPSGLLLRLRDGHVIPATRPGEFAAPALVRDANNALWLLRDQTLAIVREGALIPWAPPDEGGKGEVLAIAASMDGGLWLVIDRRVRHWRNGVWVADLGAFSWHADDRILAIAELSGNEVVIGMLKTGIHWFSPDELPRTLGRKEGLAHEWTRRLLEDREGNLWAGTAGGLNRLRRRRAAMAPDHWRGTQLRAISAGTSSDLWVGTEGAGLYHLQSRSLATDGPAKGLPDSYIWSTLVDRHGAVWAGTWGQGLFLRGSDGTFAPVPNWPSEAIIVTALFEARDGTLWAGSEGGLLCRRNGEWTWTEGKESLMYVRTIAEDAAGRIWCGTSGVGLACLDKGKVTVFRKEDGLPSDFVWTLDPEPDGTLWIGTFGGGLCRWKDGRFTQVTTAQGLPSNVICHLADEGADYWISSYAGIFRVSKAALQRCADGAAKSLACLALTRSDGLATLECSGGFQPSGARTPDGRLWFPTAKGLAVIEPTRIVPQTLPPPVVIEGASIDDRLHPGDHPLTVPPGRHRLEFRYTGLCFAAPERVRFRHRLRTLESEWIEAGSLRAVTYNYLPPGRYTFEVLACNGDGVWSPEPASLAFVVQPQFWQTWWFRIAAAAAVGLLLYGAYRLRMRQLREIEGVRYRIARDLHDEVGANLGSIAMLSQVLEQQPNPEDAGDLRRIATRTVEMLKEVVWLTNPAHDRLSELVPRMRETARQMLPRIECEFVTEDLPAELILPPAWRHHLLPIFKEALHNAARHARPSRVWIILRVERRHLELRVEDDGCGFDPATVIPGDGLLNLDRRARDMNAALSFAPRPGGGTVLQLRVAIP